jgi:hypothetical protein
MVSLDDLRDTRRVPRGRGDRASVAARGRPDIDIDIDRGVT